ncbi:addiction module protein [Flexivirga caeni]|uniref:Addiction module protein n=1 Tax=Flexivirga caeni TaxID=2294115 RepID=A0A3M9MFA5_9MICO|nr:addiction module protein [Flexivirga caeni]RNI23827.1 addiction module protein [Flexivirga caeni]
MALGVAEVERALLALSPDERAAVIHAGLLSLHDGPTEVSPTDADAAWYAEVDRRLNEVLGGRVKLGSFESTRARFAAKYPASGQ